MKILLIHSNDLFKSIFATQSNFFETEGVFGVTNEDAFMAVSVVIFMLVAATLFTVGRISGFAIPNRIRMFFAVLPRLPKPNAYSFMSV